MTDLVDGYLNYKLGQLLMEGSVALAIMVFLGVSSIRDAIRRRRQHTERPLAARGRCRALSTCLFWAARDGATGGW